MTKRDKAIQRDYKALVEYYMNKDKKDKEAQSYVNTLNYVYIAWFEISLADTAENQIVERALVSLIKAKKGEMNHDNEKK